MRIIITFTLMLISSILHAQNNWLSTIDDTTLVSNVSVPGSHNTATGHKIEWNINIGITQSLSIDEQWELGIRAFDLRPDIKDEQINIYHGALKTKLTFTRAIESILEKLEKSPGEFAIVIMRQERFGNKQQKREEWATRIGRYIASLGERVATFHRGITVGELRGKILFLSRSHYSECDKGAYIRGWSHSIKGTDNASIISYSNGKETPLTVQDFYAPLTNEEQESKLSTIISLLEQKSNNEANTERWSINYLSGYSSTLIGSVPSNKGYLRNASYINSAILEYISNRKSKNSLGIIMIDFVGKDKINNYNVSGKKIVESIIESNFAGK